MKNKVKFCFAINVIIMVAIALVIHHADAMAETGDECNVSIVSENKGRPQLGKKLEAVLSDVALEESQQLEYSWTVGGTEVSTESYYVPTEDDLEKWIVLNVYTKSDDSDERVLCAGNQLFFSKLPVVYINTDDGKNITKKADYEAASMSIQGNEKYDAQYKESDRIQIKIRGNLSSKYPVKPYKIKLEKKSDLFGMGKNKHWVLLSNYLDECCLRNTTASKLAKKLGVDAMDMQWVDVVFNGKYNGTYILAEHIRVDKKRINIKNWEDIAEDAAADIYASNKDTLEPDDLSLLEDYMKENMEWITSDEVEYNSVTYRVSDYYSDYEKNCSDISGGYLFEMSKEYDEVSQFKTKNGMPVMLNKPEYLATNGDMFEYVQNYWQEYENAAASINGYNSKGNSLYDMADIDSMVSYWLVMEIMGNNDAAEKSRYAYLDESGKMTFGPVWDFDWGSAARSICEADEDVSNGWIVSRGSLWKDWVDDPYFLMKAREKYQQIREYLEDLIKEDGIIENDYLYVRESGNALYDYIVKSGWSEWSVNCKRPSRGFETDYDVFLKFMRKRILWLDEQFADLDTLVASLSGCGRNKYVKSEDLTISIDGEKADSNICVALNNPINLNVSDNGEAVEVIEIFVNGQKVGDYYLGKKYCNVTLSPEVFNIGSDSQNLLVVIAFYNNGYVKTDYCMVTLSDKKVDSDNDENSENNPSEQQGDDDNKVTLKRVKINKCIRKKKKLTINIGRVKNAKGYKIYIYKSCKANSKAVLKKYSAKTKITITLKKKYLRKVKYVRVRAYYINSKGVKKYGRLSKPARIKSCN